MGKKYSFIREEALEIIYGYYRKKGYSEEHCRRCTDHLDDAQIERVASIIMGEYENDGEEKHCLLQGVVASSEGSV